MAVGGVGGRWLWEVVCSGGLSYARKARVRWRCGIEYIGSEVVCVAVWVCVGVWVCGVCSVQEGPGGRGGVLGAVESYTRAGCV